MTGFRPRKRSVNCSPIKPVPLFIKVLLGESAAETFWINTRTVSFPGSTCSFNQTDSSAVGYGHFQSFPAA
ncbi:hypothetical protein AOLI_G00239090 [Acnodon oligacanthus]